MNKWVNVWINTKGRVKMKFYLRIEFKWLLTGFSQLCFYIKDPHSTSIVAALSLNIRQIINICNNYMVIDSNFIFHKISTMNNFLELAICFMLIKLSFYMSTQLWRTLKYFVNIYLTYCVLLVLISSFLSHITQILVNCPPRNSSCHSRVIDVISSSRWV